MILVTHQILCGIIALCGIVWLNRTCLQPQLMTHRIIVAMIAAGAAGVAVCLVPHFAGRPLSAELRELMRTAEAVMLAGVALGGIVMASQRPRK